MSLDFQDSTEYDRLLNDQEFAVMLQFQGPVITGQTTLYTFLQIDLPRVKYRTVGVPINATDFITQDVECTVLKPSAAAVGTVTLRNHEFSAP
jgi:hypothetical protein